MPPGNFGYSCVALRCVALRRAAGPGSPLEAPGRIPVDTDTRKPPWTTSCSFLAADDRGQPDNNNNNAQSTDDPGDRHVLKLSAVCPVREHTIYESYGNLTFNHPV